MRICVNYHSLHISSDSSVNKKEEANNADEAVVRITSVSKFNSSVKRLFGIINKKYTLLFLPEKCFANCVAGPFLKFATNIDLTGAQAFWSSINSNEL